MTSFYQTWLCLCVCTNRDKPSHWSVVVMCGEVGGVLLLQDEWTAPPAGTKRTRITCTLASQMTSEKPISDTVVLPVKSDTQQGSTWDEVIWCQSERCVWWFDTVEPLKANTHFVMNIALKFQRQPFWPLCEVPPLQHRVTNQSGALLAGKATSWRL